MGELKTIYERFVAENGFEQDPRQLELVELLSQYTNFLEDKNSSLIPRFFHFSQNKSAMMSGIYIYGGVGRGKSMLMQLFYENISIKEKQRAHFHEFMLEFHKSMRAGISSNSESPAQVAKLAVSIAKRAKILCLDELQVNNIADAMIVERLFKALFENGIFLVITSNCAPNELFKDGLQRERFLPFIDLIEQKCLLFHLNSYKDYRLSKMLSVEDTYLYPLNDKNKIRLYEILKMITGGNALSERALKVVDGRDLRLHRVYGNVAVFTFNELCAMPLGAVDYIEIARNFSTIIIEEIPQLNSDQHNEALRFITLIDCLYEHHTSLICTGEVAISEIYTGGKNSFEFNRTVSRLREMQSKEYREFKSSSNG